MCMCRAHPITECLCSFCCQVRVVLLTGSPLLCSGLGQGLGLGLGFGVRLTDLPAPSSVCPRHHCDTRVLEPFLTFSRDVTLLLCVCLSRSLLHADTLSAASSPR